jgi:hypothetical protein
MVAAAVIAGASPYLVRRHARRQPKAFLFVLSVLTETIVIDTIDVIGYLLGDGELLRRWQYVAA